jgi:GNAT superfamily N-acetyltransferase
MAGEIEIGGYGPGALGRIVALHADYYARHWGFGPYFEAKVAGDLADFLTRGERPDDRLWCARAAGRVVGAIAIDGADAARAEKRGRTPFSAAAARDPGDPGETGAHLRWFIVAEALQGAGLGARLLDGALAFSRKPPRRPGAPASSSRGSCWGWGKRGHSSFREKMNGPFSSEQIDAIRHIEANLGASLHLTRDSRTHTADPRKGDSPRCR